MIGQNQLTSQIDDLVKADKFPHFCIIEGAVGGGKKTLVKYIHDVMEDSVLMWMQNTVDDVRLAISQAYKGGGDMIYAFADADNMSMSAQNALLKITEEPPSNTYFILTVSNINNVLETIRSRANIFHMEPYTQYELNEYLAPYDDGFDKKLALEVCETPGDIDLLYKNGVEKLYNFVEKVMDNIAEVSVANALKIANSIAFTDTDEGKFDLALFWKVVIMYYCNEFTADVKNMSVEELRTKARIVMSTKECIDMITKTRGINKRNVFDIWILDVRDILGEEYGQ